MCFFSTIKRILVRQWTRFTNRDTHYSNDYKKFNRIYVVRNPWLMDSISEEYRFKETNRFILDKFGKMNTILEIGCGEGHQSLYLRQVCNHLIGLDVSAIAINRARKKRLGADFLLGDIFLEDLANKSPFDLVVACEVLYYMNDVPAALRRMREIGRNILVTYFHGEMRSLDPILLSMSDCGSEVLEYEHNRWRIAWLKGMEPATPVSFGIGTPS